MNAQAFDLSCAAQCQFLERGVWVEQPERRSSKGHVKSVSVVAQEYWGGWWLERTALDKEVRGQSLDIAGKSRLTLLALLND